MAQALFYNTGGKYTLTILLQIAIFHVLLAKLIHKSCACLLAYILLFPSCVTLAEYNVVHSIVIVIIIIIVIPSILIFILIVIIVIIN